MSPAVGGEQELDPRGRRWQERLVRPISHARAVLDVEVQGAEGDGHAMRRSGMGQRWLFPMLRPPPATALAARRGRWEEEPWRVAIGGGSMFMLIVP